MDRFLWRVEMLLTNLSRRISYENWKEIRARRRLEFELAFVRFQIEQQEELIQGYIATNNSQGLTGRDWCDYQEDLATLELLIAQQNQIFGKLMVSR